MLPFLPTIPPAQVLLSTAPPSSPIFVDSSLARSTDNFFTIAQLPASEKPIAPSSPTLENLGNITADTTSISNLDTFPTSSPVNYPTNSPTNSQITSQIPPSRPNPSVTASPTTTPPFSPLLNPLQPQPPLPPIITPRLVVQRHEVRALPGQLNQIPVLNSNSPEVVFGDGILLSTFPAAGKRSPQAHLNLTLEGRFDVFTHHIARTANQEFARPMYLGVLLYNPTSRIVIVDVMQAVTYFTNPDAPFVELPDYVDNFSGNIFSGPGSRLSADILRGIHQSRFPNQIIIFPGESRMLMNEPVLIGSAISSLIRLRSNGPVYVASLSLLAPIVPPPPPELPISVVVPGSNNILRPTLTLPPPPRPVYRSPTILEWEDLVRNGTLANPRDQAPTPPNRAGSNIIYGRVGGVALGNLWQGQIVDSPDRQELTIPPQGEAISYAINTLNRGTFGTGQDQSAPIVARYPDTAYRANGNYGIQYNLSLPLYNNSGQTQSVSIALQTPIKQDEASQGLQFWDPPTGEVFFRGTVQIAYQDDFGLPRTRSVHIVQRRGQQGESLVTLRMPPGNRRLVTVDFIYPPDATPPQVLTIRTTSATTLPSTQINQDSLRSELNINQNGNQSLGN